MMTVQRTRKSVEKVSAEIRGEGKALKKALVMDIMEIQLQIVCCILVDYGIFGGKNLPSTQKL